MVPKTKLRREFSLSGLDDADDERDAIPISNWVETYWSEKKKTQKKDKRNNRTKKPTESRSVTLFIALN